MVASAPFRSWRPRSIHTCSTGARDRRRPLGELVGRTERVVRAGDEQARHGDRRQVLDAELVGLARRVQRIADQHETGEPGDGAGTVDVGRDHRRHPPAHRPSAHHDRARAAVESGEVVADRGEQLRCPVGRSRPSRRYGKSNRWTSADEASSVSIRRRLECSRSEPAPGYSSTRRFGHGALLPRLSPACVDSTRRASARSLIAFAASSSAPPWSGWTSRIRTRNCAVISRFDGDLPPSSKPRIAHRPPTWVGQRLERQRLRTGEMGDQRRTDRSPPASRLLQHGADLASVFGGQPLDGVDRTEHLGEVGADRLEVERDVVVRRRPG